MQEDLRALIRTGFDGVVAWGRRPQGSALPAIVLTIVSEVTDYTYAGATALKTTRVQADIYAASYAAALAVDAALVSAASGFRGVVGATEFTGIFLESRFDEAVEADSEPLSRISRDLMVKHKEN